MLSAWSDIMVILSHSRRGGCWFRGCGWHIAVPFLVSAVGPEPQAAARCLLQGQMGLDEYGVHGNGCLSSAPTWFQTRMPSETYCVCVQLLRDPRPGTPTEGTCQGSAGGSASRTLPGGHWARALRLPDPQVLFLMRHPTGVSSVYQSVSQMAQ